jgi:Ca2+/Na+ antiporter
MDTIINSLTDNPVYLAVAVVLALVILFGVVRKLVKLALVMAAVLIMYIAYLVYSGEDVTYDRFKKDMQSAKEVISEKAGELGKSVKKK